MIGLDLTTSPNVALSETKVALSSRLNFEYLRLTVVFMWNSALLWGLDTFLIFPNFLRF